MLLSVFLAHVLEGAAQQGMDETAALQAAREMGYRGVECDMAQLTPERIARLQACGLQAVSVYAVHELGHQTADENRRQVQAHLDAAQAVGAKRVLCVPGFARQGEDMNALRQVIIGPLREMVAQAGERGITVGVEDYDLTASPCAGCDGVMALLNAVPGLECVFDTGNFAYMLEDAEAAYRRLRPWVRHVHLKNRRRDAAFGAPGSALADVGGKLMYPSPIGEGEVPVERLVKQLARDGYEGFLSVEHFGAADQMTAMRLSAAHLRDWLGNRLPG